MHVACVLIEHLPIKVERLRTPALNSKPIILARSHDAKQSVMDFSPEAGDLTVGMPLQQALSICKDAQVLEPDLPRYHQAFSRILSALEQRSPVVEDADLGHAYVDIRGLELMYGGKAAVAQALLSAVPEAFEVKLGIAMAKFPAYVAALGSAAGRVLAVPEDVRGFLAGFPVDVLPVSWRTKAMLREFGLDRLGQVASMAIGPLQAQFGREGQLIWGLSRGVDDRPVMPRSIKQVVTERLLFPEPTVNVDALLLGIETLLSRAFSTPNLRNRYARGVSLHVEVFRGAPWTKRISFREPLADRKRILNIIKTSVTGMILPGPVEEMNVTLWGLTGQSGLQSSLLLDVRRRANLLDSLRQLEARIGRRPPIYQIREVEPWSRIPERRRALVQLSL